mgnify:FL=1
MLAKKSRGSQRSKLRERFRDHVYYKVCRKTHDAFLSQYPSIILSAEELFKDAATTLDKLLTEGDLTTEMCADLWSDTLADYRMEEEGLTDLATSGSEVAMLFYAVIFGLQAVNYSHYRSKLQKTLLDSLHTKWFSHNQSKAKEVEILLNEVNSHSSDMLAWMEEYFYSADSLTEEIEGIVHPKRTPAKKKKETIPYTLPYCCPNEETRIKRLRYAMIAMQEWGWIEEPESADDFLDLFSGKARQCNIKWTGKSLAILTLLIKRLLEQPYMETKKGCSVSAIVKNQFGKNPSNNPERVNEEAKKRIDWIVRILDHKQRLPRLDNRESETEGEEDSIYLAEQEVMRGNLHSTKDLRHNYD